MITTYVVSINEYFETIVECSDVEIAIATAIDYFRMIDEEDIKEIKIEKF